MARHSLYVFFPGLAPRASIDHSFPFLREALCRAAISANKILKIARLVSGLFRRLRSEKVAPSGQLKTNDLHNIDFFCRCGGGKRLAPSQVADVDVFETHAPFPARVEL